MSITLMYIHCELDRALSDNEILFKRLLSEEGLIESAP